jgi:tetratricopeptide (TPR) repeat protein
MLEGKLALVDGKPEQARTKFEQVLAASAAIQTKTRATLGKAEALILADDAAGAVVESQAALNMATALQGGVPYSNNTGLAWLMLGRALQARGDLAQARKAYEAAVTNLANTVDADHPELLRARQLLDSTADAPRQRS